MGSFFVLIKSFVVVVFILENQQKKISKRKNFPRFLPTLRMFATK